MAKYTMELRQIVETVEGKAVWDKVMSKYPLYEKQSKEEYIPSIIPTREELNKLIYQHYKYREIGFETQGRFMEELENVMCVIMPYYNQRFFTTDFDYNVIWNVDYQRTIDTSGQGASESQGSVNSNSQGQTTSSGTSNASNTAENKDKSVNQNTPQSNIHIEDNISDLTHASDVNWNEGKSNGSSEASTETNSNTTSAGTSQTNDKSSSTNKSTTLETTKGNFGVVSAQDLVDKYRSIIINVVDEILNDTRLNELFMGVY